MSVRERVEAATAVVAVVIGLGVAFWQILESKTLARQGNSVQYCNLSVLDPTLNEFEEKSAKIARAVQKAGFDNINIGADIFADDLPMSDIKTIYEKLSKITIRDPINDSAPAAEVPVVVERNIRPLLKLANFYVNAIEAVEENVFEEQLIRKCISVNMICFRERYAIRLPIFWDEEKDASGEVKLVERKEMIQIKNFIDRGGKSARDYCSMATDGQWKASSRATAKRVRP